METAAICKPSHKEWRRRAKKERRRRLRTREARARDLDAERPSCALSGSREYSNGTESQGADAESRAIEDAREHDIREQKWLEEEARAQKEWRIQQDRRARARQEQLDQEARIREEYEAKQEAARLRREEARREQEAESRRIAEVRREIDEYVDEGGRTPEVLRAATDTQPGKEPCPFFSKTGACRYGDTCSRNHRRVALSKVLLVPGFYSHFSLEKNSAEYDTDVALEYDNSETRRHFREFYNDVAPELETFGRVKTLKFCRNAEIHLRGNMYVEYYTEREAARALRSLKGRWYAGRRLNCEFADIKSWRNAICGMPKCPKGRACNFLHTIRNPRDEYHVKSPPRSRARPAAGQRQCRPSREESSSDRRWSDSPDSGAESPSRTGGTGETDGRGRERDDRGRERDDRGARKRRRESKRSRNASGDEGSEDRARIPRDEKYSARRGLAGNSVSGSKAKRRRKEDHRRGGRGDGSEKRDSLKKTRDKVDETKWDEPNPAACSGSDSNAGVCRAKTRSVENERRGARVDEATEGQERDS